MPSLGMTRSSPSLFFPLKGKESQKHILFILIKWFKFSHVFMLFRKFSTQLSFKARLNLEKSYFPAAEMM